MRPVCVKCGAFMQCHKNERCVAVQSAGSDYQLWSGDVYKCATCGIQIVTAFGRDALADAGADPDRYRSIRNYEEAQQNVLVVNS